MADTKHCWNTVLSVNSFIPQWPIRQIYLWVFTSDHKVIIVSKDGKSWQFPGGKPKENEEYLQTLIREIKEETGMSIDRYIDDIRMFGYYNVTQRERGTEVTFHQLRFYLVIDEKSSDLNLQPEENPQDADPIKFTKVVGIPEIEKDIPWLSDVKEYNAIKLLLTPNFP